MEMFHCIYIKFWTKGWQNSWTHCGLFSESRDKKRLYGERYEMKQRSLVKLGTLLCLPITSQKIIAFWPTFFMIILWKQIITLKGLLLWILWKVNCKLNPVLCDSIHNHLSLFSTSPDTPKCLKLRNELVKSLCACVPQSGGLGSGSSLCLSVSGTDWVEREWWPMQPSLQTWCDGEEGQRKELPPLLKRVPPLATFIQ